MSASIVICMSLHVYYTLSVSCGSSPYNLGPCVLSVIHFICCSRNISSDISCECRLVHRTRTDSSSTFLCSITKQTSHLTSPLIPLSTSSTLPFGTTRSYNSHKPHIAHPAVRKIAVRTLGLLFGTFRRMRSTSALEATVSGGSSPARPPSISSRVSSSSMERHSLWSV